MRFKYARINCKHYWIDAHKMISLEKLQNMIWSNQCQCLIENESKWSFRCKIARSAAEAIQHWWNGKKRTKKQTPNGSFNSIGWWIFIRTKKTQNFRRQCWIVSVHYTSASHSTKQLTFCGYMTKYVIKLWFISQQRIMIMFIEILIKKRAMPVFFSSIKSQL